MPIYFWKKKSDYLTVTEYSRNFKIFQKIRSLKPIQIYEILYRRKGHRQKNLQNCTYNHKK